MRDTLFASCDVLYYKRFAKPFVNSAIAHGNAVHVHIINPEIGLEKIEHELVTYSFQEYCPDTREFYAASRFFAAPEILLGEDDLRMLILDIDCVIRGKIELPDAAVGMFLREPFGANDWERRGTRVAAGAVMFDSTAWLFAKRVAERLEELPQYWFADQIALAETLDEFDMAINFHDFSQDEKSLVDWEFRDDSLIWTAKGNRKDDIKFMAEQYLYK